MFKGRVWHCMGEACAWVGDQRVEACPQCGGPVLSPVMACKGTKAEGLEWLRTLLTQVNGAEGREAAPVQ